MTKAPTKIGPGMALSMLDRAVKEKMSIHQFGRSEIAEAVTFFDPNGNGLRCLYCGAENPTRWDHFVPVDRGGDTVLGNMVRACQPCDDSKQNKTLDEWFGGKAPKRPPPERKVQVEQTVLQYQQHFGYVPRQFLEKLSERQSATYHAFRRRLDDLRRFLFQEGLLLVDGEEATVLVESVGNDLAIAEGES